MLYTPDNQRSDFVVTVNSATAVPKRYYKAFAKFLTEYGFIAVTYDYRGIGGSKPSILCGFPAQARDWVLQDRSGVLDWVMFTLQPHRLFHIGHSYGGQTTGLLRPNQPPLPCKGGAETRYRKRSVKSYCLDEFAHDMIGDM